MSVSDFPESNVSLRIGWKRMLSKKYQEKTPKYSCKKYEEKVVVAKIQNLLKKIL